MELLNGTLTEEFKHIPVLLTECLDALTLQTNSVFVDSTLGGAGHSIKAAHRIGATGKLIGIDQDEVALNAARQRLEALPRETRPQLHLLRGNFENLDDLLLSIPVAGIDAILFDLGVSSVQIDSPNRGFSFKENCPLDMRMDNSGKQTLTAQEVINTYNEADLARVIRNNSDEKWASRIAQFIVQAREHKPIETSGQLVEIIKCAIPASARRAGGHPAKRTFQALRIEVNDELGALTRGLHAAIRWLNPGGRIAVITYHSLEDRIVKEVFSSYVNRCTCPPDLPRCVCGLKPVLSLVNRKPILPSSDEIQENPRSRSAKLRVAQKL